LPAHSAACILLSCYEEHPSIHSFPTRRSSDLPALRLCWPGDHMPGPFLRRAETEEGFYRPPIRDGGQMIMKASPITSSMGIGPRSEEHTSELQSRENLVCRLLLEKKKIYN